uniref:heat-inducible transcriptional repressor HrcA n=1 Tax=Kamptonema formosum TaxID=331992 RepID=UPI0003453ED3|nr:heat-inducible transcriptional repressor HrcA [Oscillatoria sp. PCC 10802]
MQVTLTNRQQHILWATVRHYIATAEPVGSKALVEEYNLSVSPATIRSCLSYLEKAGLLYQPHTSAGRVPSDSGYRVYVDHLLAPSEVLTRNLENVLRDRLHWEETSLEALLRGAAQLLSTLSGYITLITMPQTTTSRLRHLQLVLLDRGRVMLVAVTDSYETQSVLMELTTPADSSPPEPELVERELQILSNFLNSQLRERPLAELSQLDLSELDRQFQRYADFLRALLADLTRRQTPATSRILISGVAEVLRQPEFSELNQVQTLIQLLEEEQDQLWPLISATKVSETAGKRVNVRIGAENPLEPIRTCTLISASYRRGSVPVGSVGVLGPTRMVYENAIAMVEAAADYLSDALS